MPAVTAQLLIDLTDDLTYATDLTAYWVRDRGFDLPAVGRNEDLGLADIGKMTLALDNRDARFSPKNAASPYFNTWHPYHHIKVKVTFNGVTYDVFTGVITKIQVSVDPKQQLCFLQAADLMYVLSRTDIRCPLMTGYTGPIINRLIDYAEANEKVTNPRFDELQGTGGYSPIGTASILRMTTGAILEGQAAMRVTTPIDLDGVRYTMSGLNGQKIVVSAYVQADVDELSVHINMRDTVGLVATGTPSALQFGRWKRYSTFGTYNGGSTSQYIEIVRPATGNSAQWTVGGVHAVPFVSAIERAVDEGQSILDNYAYARGPALKAIQEVTENELGALFYTDGAGNAVFEDKAHRWVSPHTVSQATFDERGTPTYSETAEDRMKTVVLDYPRFIEGTAGTVLWDLDRVPVMIPANGTVSFEVDYGGGSATDVILPVAGTDYLANSQPGGGAVDETSNVLVTGWNDWGAGAEITLENQQTYPVFLTFLQVRGTPIREASDRTPARANGASGPAIAAVLTHDFRLNGREPSVQAWASYLANRYDDQQPRIRLSLSAPFPVAATTSDLTQILARKVSDRVTVTNDNLPFSLKVNEDFYINKITRRINADSVEADWDLVPVEPSYFIIGTSLIGGADVIAP